MIARGLNVAEQPFQTETAIETLAADDFHGLGDHANGGVGGVGFSRENILAILVDGFES